MPGANIGEQTIRRIRYTASLFSKDFRDPKPEVGWAFSHQTHEKKQKFYSRLFSSVFFVCFVGSINPQTIDQSV
jgi:hypothetical protein